MEVESETDMRFNYCACAIATMIEDWSGIDKEKLTSHILSCRTYEGGFSWVPFGESHSGITYCAVASLALIQQSKGKSIRELLSEDEIERLVRFLCFRQHGGF